VTRPEHVRQAGRVAEQRPSALLGRKSWGLIAASDTANVVVAVISGTYLWPVVDKWANTPLWGPNPISATTSALIGSWEGASGAFLSFSTNGQFEATDLPTSITTGTSLRWSVPAQCSTGGRWSIEPAGEVGPGQPPEVDLDIGPSCEGGFEFPIQMERVNSRLELYFYIGDPDDDNEFVFKKLSDYEVAVLLPSRIGCPRCNSTRNLLG
jgi:hypothetical protein